ncbi:hypothetical protein A3C32_03205 [Candidatus Daviesbacteria bacterium RIFCSPHIGHO2_02_FULL_41_14]|nr:MAG: hypothetical protein A3C32_03205 [Candidatus Daviesbacteria bacterium RIFCSPHIGHO2_02_FULL_41_14]
MVNHKTKTLKNGLTLITVDLPHLDSVTTFISVGAGSRYETRRVNGISHFLEHMFFKGSKKYPTAEEISKIVDSIGAINNAATDKEITYYWIKSSAKHLETASDILSSMLKEPLMVAEEIEREKGVILEEMRMYRDDPARYSLDLYEMLQFGDQPLGWEVIGTEKAIKSMKREDFLEYINSLYSPENMALIYVGKLPKNIEDIARKYFLDLPKARRSKFLPYKQVKQSKPKVSIHYKKTEQVSLVFGVEAYDRNNKKRYAASLLSTILGEGMSSRLFIQIRERRGLAYRVKAAYAPYVDSGVFIVYAGLKLEKIEEGIRVIKEELEKVAKEGVTSEELQKAKEMERGHLALRSESTNFLATHFGVEFVLDRKIETFDEYLQQIEAVRLEEIQEIAKELFRSERYNLQLVGPFKSPAKFEKILSE